MKRHVTCFVEKAGFEPRTLGTKAERYDNCATRPVENTNNLISVLKLKMLRLILKRKSMLKHKDALSKLITKEIKIQKNKNKERGRKQKENMKKIENIS
jgi:hypothetical protein